MDKNHILLAFFVVILLSGCGGGSDSEQTQVEAEPTVPVTSQPAQSSRVPNILFIIADDMGKDATTGYNEGSIKPRIPNIEQIASSGLTFNNLWVSPVCSPTRASILTGKYANKTGVLWSADVLDASETTLQQYINNQTNYEYATAVIGKWHLSAADEPYFNPENLGVDYYAGLLSGSDEYYQWTLSEGGTRSNQNSYITEKFTDLSIDWISQQDKPWFLWLAYTAPHKPFHAPPNDMHSQGDLVPYEEGMEPMPYFMASIEAMDYQIGRLINSISPEDLANTTIIVIGDNGSPSQVAQSPYTRNKVKGTLFQGGINTPMFISGAGVERMGIDDHLIDSTDLFTTIAELAGVNVSEIHDSKSFKPLLTQSKSIREYQFAEMSNDTVTAWAISNGRYKLIVEAEGSEQLYNLVVDPYENTNLLEDSLSGEEEIIKLELEAELLTLKEGV